MSIDAVTAVKLNAARLIEAVETVGGTLARTVMVGDADTDAGATRASGTPLILVDFGYTEIPTAKLAPNLLLHHFDDPVRACAFLFWDTLARYSSRQRLVRLTNLSGETGQA